MVQVALMVLCLALQDSDALTITLDDKPYPVSWFSLGARGKTAQPDDLLRGPGGIWMLVGPERTQRFRQGKEGDGLLYQEVEGGARKVVAVYPAWEYKEEKRIYRNPLSTLSAEEIRGLRGVSLGFWDKEIQDLVSKIDPARTCVTLRLNSMPGEKVDFPALPKDLRHLALTDDYPQDLSAIKDLANLRWLSLEVRTSPFDASVLRPLKELRRLDYRMRHSEHLETLGELTSLRALNFRWQKMETIAFAKTLKALEDLDIDHTEVSDLSPLEGLPALKRVSADGAPVSRLPRERLPALRELRIMSTKLTDADIAAFQKANPDCRITHRWSSALSDALRTATGLKIRSGGVCHRDPASEKVLYESTDPATIQQFSALLVVGDNPEGGHCMCCGDPSIEFYEGKELKVEIGFHHGRSLRWQGWPSDAVLTAEAAEAIIRWMAAHNVTGPLKDREEAAERAKAEQAKQARALAGLKPATVAAFRQGNKEFGAALEKDVPDPAARIDLLFRMLGISNESWSMQEWVEQQADYQLKTFPKEALIPRAEAALLGDNRLMKRGAARFWTGFRSPISDWSPASDSPVWKNVIAFQQEARYYPVRQEALQNLLRWRQVLPKDVVDEALRRGLRDPETGVRRQAMLIAGELGHLASAPLLMDALDGKKVDPIALAPIPAEEERPKGGEYDSLRLPEQDYAALGLGLMGHAPARPALQARAASPSVEVALALLGDGARLKAAHFNGSSQSTEVQVAAVDAVIRFKGRYGLKEILGYRQAGFWWEEERAAGRIVEMLKAEKAPGLEKLAEVKAPKDLKPWFDAFGSQYLKRFDE